MVYGYVNRLKGETDEFLKDIRVDKIIYFEKPGYDFSFAEKEDLIIINDFTSVCDNLKELLKFSQFINETELQVTIAGNEFFNTGKAFGKMLMGILIYLNQYDDECFRKDEKKSI